MNCRRTENFSPAGVPQKYSIWLLAVREGRNEDNGRKCSHEREEKSISKSLKIFFSRPFNAPEAQKRSSTSHYFENPNNFRLSPRRLWRLGGQERLDTILSSGLSSKKSMEFRFQNSYVLNRKFLELSSGF